MFAPIIIGMTGGSEGEGDAVSAALRAIFDLLDQRYPGTPKILLTALATGVDILAVEDVIARKGWEVVSPLALPLELHLREHDEPAAKKLRALIDAESPRRKVRVFTLDPLRHKIEPRPLTAAELTQATGTINPHRADHHEQAALFIAQRCAILIAVARAGDSPERVSAARIVQYRLDGSRDPAALGIVGRSRVLLDLPLLDAPSVGPVWLVDPRTADLPRAQPGKGPFVAGLPQDENIPPAG